MITKWMTQNTALFTEVGLHFLWQGTAIAILAWLLSRYLTGSPRSRAAIYLTAMIAMACAVPLTAWILKEPAVTQIPLEATPAFEGASGPAFAKPLSQNPAPLILEEPQSTAVPWLIGTYLLGLILMLARVLRGYLWSINVRRKSHVVGDAHWTDALKQAVLQMKLRTTPVMVWSDRVVSPVVTGIFRPVIILPIALMSGLPMAQAQSILAHEIAHLRRWDHLIVFLQRTLEALLFFHPAVWFVSRRLEQEREKSCDDLVIAMGSDPADYAEALVRCSTVQNHSLALAAAHDSQLSQRILRLLGQPERHPVQVSRGGWLAISGLICGLLIMTLTPAQSEENTEEKSPEEVAADQVPLYEQDPAQVSAITEKLNTIILPLVDFKNVTVEEAIGFLHTRSRELDLKNHDKANKGVNFVIKKSKDGTDSGKVKIKKLRLKNIPLRIALQYICDQAECRYKVDGFAVTVSPLNTEQTDDTIERRWIVPPNFIPFITDPIDPHRPKKAKRPSIKALLQGLGVTFPEESSANFLKNSNTLIVKNSGVNMELIDAIVEAAREELKAQRTFLLLDKVIVPEVNFQNTTLEEAIDFVRVHFHKLDPKNRQLSFVLKTPKENKAEAPIINSLKLKKVGLGNLLKLICKKVGYTYNISEFEIMISPEMEVLPLFPGDTLPIKNEAKPGKDVVNRKLTTIIIPSINMKKATLKEALDFLQEQSKKLDPQKTGIKFEIDPLVLKEKVPAIKGLTLKHIPMMVILQYICDATKTRYIIKDGAVKIVPQ